MEGLIPMVYKAIKRNRTHRRYQCLSTGAAQSYNIADFYMDGQSHVHLTSSTEKAGSFQPESDSHHRRYKSMGDFSVGFPSMDHSRTDASPKASKQLVRFGSHRMFSCVTGA
ncbi:hypothetical protein SLEP1_g18093 [Rubroshorea leprosula]|uniref:Uncharacterized protein n=1 Tax=Rubroshorea leprosula TaxID=152421 RepID=A0AAV5IZZ6_9ROSI|nr:hypothetical protein SLEP1_g18093 [Rubroshorea leprosula]